MSSFSAMAMVGGEPAPAGVSPTSSVVFLAFGESSRCTGVVIGKRLLLTDAHCMSYPKPSYQIIFTNDLTPILRGETKARIRRVRNVYRPTTRGQVDPLSDDVAIVELNADVPEDVEIAALPERELELLAGTSVTAYGFGLQNKEAMQLPMLPIGPRLPWEPIRLRRHTFQTTMPTLAYFKGIHLDYHRWFVNQSEGGICLGDSGGPVFLDRPGQKPLLIGLNGATVPEFHLAKDADAAPTCAANAYITRVDTLNAWIQTVIRNFRTFRRRQSF